MTFFADNSSYSYIEEYSREKTVNIGWLDESQQFEKEEPTKDILDLLWGYTLYATAQTRGIHECELCDQPHAIVETNNGVSVVLGSAEIRVFGDDGLIYAAPNLLYHYVKEHKYKLPSAFKRALARGVKPPEQEYILLMAEFGLDLREVLKATPENKPFRLF